MILNTKDIIIKIKKIKEKRVKFTKPILLALLDQILLKLLAVKSKRT
jgi:hypothetical protein